jgi:hypothetical protein
VCPLRPINCFGAIARTLRPRPRPGGRIPRTTADRRRATSVPVRAAQPIEQFGSPTECGAQRERHEWIHGLRAAHALDTVQCCHGLLAPALPQGLDAEKGRLEGGHWRVLALQSEGTPPPSARHSLRASSARPNNPMGDVVDFASVALDARLESSAAAAVPKWKRAVEMQGALTYDEPPAWYYPGARIARRRNADFRRGRRRLRHISRRPAPQSEERKDAVRLARRPQSAGKDRRCRVGGPRVSGCMEGRGRATAVEGFVSRRKDR